ncbi:Transcriptional regulator [Leptospirillum ferriphilum]|uniref:Transcriptional regulator n=1 Tax=Leptospirillum ferriphilum TaxID=178606 RepID=A0A094WA05_9BACT|nr:Transcriptional regulator [Leptospirillum ferriphilum]
MRHHERFNLEVPVSFRGSTGGFRKGVLTNLSLTGCFIRPLRRTPLDGWVRLRISSRETEEGESGEKPEGAAGIETWGFVTRADEEGFGLHFNWIERENLRRFGRFLLDYAPDHPDVRKLLVVNESSFQFLGPTPSGHDAMLPEAPTLEGSLVESLLRQSWSSFLEHSPSHFFDGMIDWISNLVVEREESPKAFDWCEDWFFLGNSSLIHDIIQKIQIVAPSGLPVLLLGETGVGKEMFARLCHEMGGPVRGPFCLSTVALFLLSWRKASFSVMKKEAFPARMRRTQDILKPLQEERCFWMKSGSSPFLSRSSCCGSFRRKNSAGSGLSVKFPSMRGLCARPIRI